MLWPVELGREESRRSLEDVGRKTDKADALSVGIAAHTANRLTTAVIDEAIAALRCLTEHRDDLVRTRTQTVNRLHALLAQLRPSACLAD